MHRLTTIRIGAAFGASLFAARVAAADPLDVLVAAYPDVLARHDATHLYFRDGTSLPAADGEPDKPFAAAVRRGSILDQFRIAYPAGRPTREPGVDEDPGRIRNAALFAKMYGDCRKGEVAPRLKPVTWLLHTSGQVVRMTSANGVADRLQAVSNQLDALSPGLKAFLYPSAGTYNCRPVADTGQLSMHSYGAAIDINVKHSDYWLWHARGATTIPYVNRVPYEIAAIFEKHGFIWGGKWYHYDTMHFEYRPELLDAH